MARTFVLNSPIARHRAARSIYTAPDGYVCKIGEAKRTNAQNDKMWAMLTDISVQMPLGRRHTPDDWKAVMMNACGWECQFIEGLDGRPFPQGFRSSNLTKSQMQKLIDYMDAFGAENGVIWSDPESSTTSQGGVSAPPGKVAA